MRATPTRRKLEPTHSVPAGMAATTSVASSGRRSTQHGGTGGDPVIKGEINWSVSQLRSLFNQQTNSNGHAGGGQHSPNGGSSSSTSSSTNGGSQYQHMRLQQQQQVLDCDIVFSSKEGCQMLNEGRWPGCMKSPNHTTLRPSIAIPPLHVDSFPSCHS